jgi:hypothetical protein
MATETWQTMAAYTNTEAVIEEYVARKGWLLSAASNNGKSNPAKVWPPMQGKRPFGYKYHQLKQGQCSLDAPLKHTFITKLMALPCVVGLDDAEKAHVRAEVIKLADACVEAKAANHIKEIRASGKANRANQRKEKRDAAKANPLYDVPTWDEVMRQHKAEGMWTTPIKLVDECKDGRERRSMKNVCRILVAIKRIGKMPTRHSHGQTGKMMNSLKGNGTISNELLPHALKMLDAFHFEPALAKKIREHFESTAATSEEKKRKIQEHDADRRGAHEAVGTKRKKYTQSCICGHHSRNYVCPSAPRSRNSKLCPGGLCRGEGEEHLGPKCIDVTKRARLRERHDDPDWELLCHTCRGKYLAQQQAEARKNGDEIPTEVSMRGLTEATVKKELAKRVAWKPDTSLSIGGKGCDAKLAYPDLLYVRYDELGRIAMVADCEIDEHSHSDRRGYPIDCAVARVTALHESISLLANRRAEALKVPHVPPLVVTLCFNPDACDDAKGKKLGRLTRIARFADEINKYYSMPLDEVRALVATDARPRLKALFYHTKSNDLLDAYAACGVIAYDGNYLEAPGDAAAAGPSSASSEMEVEDEEEDEENMERGYFVYSDVESLDDQA